MPNFLGNKLRPLMVMRRAVCIVCFRVLLVHIFFTGLSYGFLRMHVPAPENWIFGFRALEVLMIVYVILRWFKNFYILTPEKILAHRGVFVHDQDFFALKNIESISLHQCLLGKIFRYGTIKMYAPTLKKQVCIRNINAPKRKMQIIEKLLTPHRKKDKDRDVIVVQGE